MRRPTFFFASASPCPNPGFPPAPNTAPAIHFGSGQLARDRSLRRPLNAMAPTGRPRASELTLLHPPTSPPGRHLPSCHHRHGERCFRIRIGLTTRRPPFVTPSGLLIRLECRRSGHHPPCTSTQYFPRPRLISATSDLRSTAPPTRQLHGRSRPAGRTPAAGVEDTYPTNRMDRAGTTISVRFLERTVSDCSHLHLSSQITPAPALPTAAWDASRRDFDLRTTYRDSKTGSGSVEASRPFSTDRAPACPACASRGACTEDEVFSRPRWASVICSTECSPCR